jgi:putative ABC transport system permease protein
VRLYRSLRVSIRTLVQHRLRTTLAVAAGAVGVAGVLALTAVGEGARTAVIERIGGLGRNLLVVSLRIPPNDERRLPVELRAEDADAIRQGSPAILLAAPAADRNGAARFGRVRSPVNVVGTTPEWRDIREFPLQSGRFFTAAENDACERVAVLGSSVARSLFGDSVPPLGRLFRIGRTPFRVIGVLRSRGLSAAGGSIEDDWVVVPLKSAQRRLFNDDQIARIYLAASSPAVMSRAELDAASILQARHPQLEAVVQNQQVVLEAELTAQHSFRRLIRGLAALSLLVGAAGIMSIMLLTVRERRAEIGLRLAVGARRSDIVAQFLLEAVLLAASGGVVGLLAGTAAARATSSLTTWQAQITWAALAAAGLSAVVTGVASGVLPARRASRLDPVDALRTDP